MESCSGPAWLETQPCSFDECWEAPAHYGTGAETGRMATLLEFADTEDEEEGSMDLALCSCGLWAVHPHPRLLELGIEGLALFILSCPVVVLALPACLRNRVGLVCRLSYICDRQMGPSSAQGHWFHKDCHME